MDARCIRIKKFADTKISVYVWPGLSDDLRRVHHIECISKKASKRLYSVRFLKREGVTGDSILTVYLTTIRPILEYGVQV